MLALTHRSALQTCASGAASVQEPLRLSHGPHHRRILLTEPRRMDGRHLQLRFSPHGVELFFFCGCWAGRRVVGEMEVRGHLDEPMRRTSVFAAAVRVAAGRDPAPSAGSCEECRSGR